MTEKINGRGLRPTDTAGGSRLSEGSGATGTPSASAGGLSDTGDTVNSGRSSMVLSELQRAVSALPVVDAGRVDALRLAVTSGAYEVDSASVADNMIRLERELS